MHLIITGGTSYIGRRVVRMALRQGHSVTLLGTDRPIPGVQAAVPWRLGDPIPEGAWSRPADAVIHLAHNWHATGLENDDTNLTGTASLLAAARRARVPRFVFASSLSARPDALNRYGRVKYSTEAVLEGAGETAVRIGLVYGGAPQSLWGTLGRISALPILPMIGARQPVQPIHLADAADGLIRIASMDEPPRTIVLAGAPLPFAEFLQIIANRLHGRRPILVPVPLAPLLFALDALVKLGIPVHGARERLLGLAGTRVQSGEADAARLGLSLRPVDKGLPTLADRHRRGTRAAEAAAYLRYVLGRPASPSTLRRYLRGWHRYDFGATVVPPFLQKCPPLLRVAEPLPWDRRARAKAVRARLHAATVLAEASPEAGTRFYAEQPRSAVAAWLKLLATGTSEAALLLPRAIVGQWLWR